MRKRLKIAAFIAASSCLVIASAQAEVVTVEATGVGQTRAEAVTHGLVEAVQKATGVRIDQASITGLNQRVLQVDANANQSSGLSSASQDFSATVKTSQGVDMVASPSGGAIKTFTVLSSKADNRGFITVTMRVEVEKFKSVMAEAAKRIRIAVAEFEGLDADTALRLQDRMKAYFVQSRRFSVLDRSETPQYAKEMALVTSAAANMGERVRFGQVLGADFIVVGKVRFNKIERKILDPVSMKTSQREEMIAEVTFSAIEIATRQILWANTLKLNVGANIASSVDAVGQVVGSQVSETLFPLRVLTFDDLSALTINQGGLSVSVGQKYTLMELGRDLIDPDTKESLGRREVELGLVEITRVDNNVSYAKLVTGKITKSASMILRSASADKAPAIAPSTNPGTRSKAFD
jgi:hypothetical protein